MNTSLTSGSPRRTVTPATVPPAKATPVTKPAPVEGRPAIARAACLLFLIAFASACVASQAAEPAPSATSTRTPLATADAVHETETPTGVPEAAEPDEAVAAVAVPPVAELAPPVAVAPDEALEDEPEPAPPPAVVRGGTALPLPEGTTVVWGGCASDGTCYWYNFYWAPTREVVMQDGEGEHKVQHELCHAHQHLTISGGAPLPPSDYDLDSWRSTGEGRSFAAAVAGLAWPWTHSAVNLLEDFAWTCAYWYLDPAYLLATSSARYDWAAANLP